MKKQLFLASSILLSGIMAAQVSKRTSHIPLNISNQSMPYIDVLKLEETSVPSNYKPKEAKPLTEKEKNLKTSALTTGVIGTTFYDLQSNGSVGDRIVVNPDGTIAACWTFAGSFTPTYADRGTGYNYFNGTTWGPAPTARLESGRVGWGNIVNTRSGKELVLAHNSVNSPLNSRPVKGTGTFTETTTAIPNATTTANMWPRMVSSGDTVYSIYVSNIVSPAIPYQGVNGALCFSRSKDGGATWDITNIVPAGLDSSHYLSHNGDSYAIAAKGTTVVIAAGGNGKDIVLSKSVDAGVTWTYKVALKFPIHKWDPATMITDITGDGVADIVDSNDGNISVGLDNNNEGYVFYGYMRVKSADPLTTTGSFSYYPGTDGLMMWKESFAENTDTGGVLVAQIQDLYQKGTIYFPTADPGVTNSLSFGRWQCSLTSYPSVAFDNNTMYLTYSSIVDSLMSAINQTKLVRHVYIMKSSDGGITWSYPCDLVESPNGIPYEGVLGSLAKRVDGNVHLIYQRDLAPGNGIPGTSTSPNNDQVENNTTPTNGSNDIVYIKIPVGDISCTETSAIGINELHSSISSLNFYPSPASTNGTIDVVLHDNAKMEIVILNSVGQTVYSTSLTGVAGGNKVDVNLSNLNSGLYFYQVRVANSKAITKKFVIEK